jgi:hypothetical protein
MATTQKEWRRLIKRQCRANNLDALRIAFAIKCNDRWNRELRDWHIEMNSPGSSGRK